MKKLFIVFLTLFFLVGCQSSGGGLTNQTIESISNSDVLSIYYFYGSTCPFCAMQSEWLDQLEKDYEGIEVLRFEVYGDSSNQRLFREVSEVYEVTPRGVPTTFIGNRSFSGFSESIAGEMESFIFGCLSSGCEELI